MDNSYLNPDRKFFIEQIKFNKEITRAKGHYLYDSEGNAYIDFLAQFGAIPFGYNPDFLWDALNDIRLKEEPSLIQPLISPGAEALARELVAVAPPNIGYVTFTNSGAESVEAAIKVARSKTQRPVILGTVNAFHGKTLGAVSVTSKEVYKVPFLTDTSQFEQVSYGDLSCLENRLSRKDVAAFIVEAVQGEGGMITPPPGYLLKASELCRKFGTLFVLDEVQTGLGRTGRLFAAEHEGVQPDIILLAKALGGGIVPLGACLISKRAWTSSFGKYHSSTFANNHLTCSVGLATLRYLLSNQQALVKQVNERGNYLRNHLEGLVQRYPKAFEKVDGLGLMQGIRLMQWSGEDSYAMSVASTTGNAVPLVCGYLLNEHNILTCPTLNENNVLRIEPPLTIKTEEIDQLINGLENVGKLISKGDFASLLSYTTGISSNYVSVPFNINFSTVNYSHIQFPSPVEKCLGKFAFLIHPTELKDILRIMPASLQYFSDQQKEKFIEWVSSWSSGSSDPGIAYHLPAIRSKLGGYVEGWLVCSLLRPQQMLKLSSYARKVLMQNYIDLCLQKNIDVIGLGAFTSVITRAGTELVDCGVTITTGNSLTAMASVESLKVAAKERGISLSKINVGVVGASGSVGRLVCKSLAFDCAELTLFGNPKNPDAVRDLQVFAGEIYQDLITHWIENSYKVQRNSPLINLIDYKAVPSSLLLKKDNESLLNLYFYIEKQLNEAGYARSPIRVTVDLEQYLPKMSAVVCATSHGHSFIDPSLLAPSAIICDAARPPDVRASVRHTRSDTFVYEGGLIKLPEKVSFGSANLVGLPRGINLACLSETIVLTMSGVRRNYSIGHKIPLEEAREVLALAYQHGFEVLMPSRNEEIFVNYFKSLSSWNSKKVSSELTSINSHG